MKNSVLHCIPTHRSEPEQALSAVKVRDQAVYQFMVQQLLLVWTFRHSFIRNQRRSLCHYGRVFTSGFSGRLASDNRKSRGNSCLKSSESANFNRILIKFKQPNQLASASGQLISANEESLAVIQVRSTTGVLFLFSRHIIQIHELARTLPSFNLMR